MRSNDIKVLRVTDITEKLEQNRENIILLRELYLKKLLKQKVEILSAIIIIIEAHKAQSYVLVKYYISKT